jgi:hypothetical protein
VFLFAAVVAAHVLVVLFFPVGSAPSDTPEQEISFATLLAPMLIEQQTSRPTQRGQSSATTARRPAETMQATRGAEANQTIQDAVVSNASQSDSAPTPAPSINWAGEAQIAADNQVRADVESSRQAAALSQWRSRVMPSSNEPEARQFRWDYARTHRLESSALGLNINLNDRCSVLISLYLVAIMGGCKIGELPVHGDLFTHMGDDPDSSAPPGR